MSLSNQIKVECFSATQDALYVIDTKGRLWVRNLREGAVKKDWVLIGSLPEEPDTDPGIAF